MVIRFFHHAVRTGKQLIGLSSLSAKVHFSPFFTEFRNGKSVYDCTDIFRNKSANEPLYQHLIHGKESVALHQIVHSHSCKCRKNIQPFGNVCRQSIIFVPVQDAVHQAIEECDNIAGLVGDKALPCCRKLCLHISPSISNEQCYQKPFQTRLCIGVSEMLLTELPECRQQVVFFKLLQESIVHQLTVHQHDAHNFLKRAGTRFADCTQQTDKDIFFIKVLDFQIIEPLSALFVGEKLDVLLNNRLVLFLNTQVNRQQGGSVSKEPSGISTSVFQMVVPYIRLRKRCINQIIRGLIHTLQKILCIELVIRLEMVDLRILKLHRLHILGKFCLVIVPENQFPGLPGKFRIQAVYNLFQVQFCHINFLYLIDSALWGISYRQLRLDPFIACDAANIIVNILHDAMIPHCVQ